MSRIFKIRRYILTFMVLLVVVSLIPTSPVLALESDREETRPERVPVILIHGLGGSPAKTWGVPSGDQADPRGMYAFLVGLGYRPGQDLFWADYSQQPDRDYVELAENVVAPLVRTVVERTGSPKVDLIAHQAGALAARYYISQSEGRHSGDRSGNVRNLIMLGPPNHGSFLAGIVRAEAEVARQESWRRERGIPRSLEFPSGESEPPPREPAAYVGARSYGFYEPLYHRFITEERFLARPSGVPRAEPFETWFYRNFQDEYDRAIRSGQEPLAKEGGEYPPEEERSLTAAYYEYLAMKTAANNYVRLVPLAESLGRDVADDLEIGQDWRTTVLQFLVKRLIRFASEVVLPWLSSGARALALDQGTRLTGIDPLGPGLARLVPEQVAIPIGTGARGETLYDRPLANYFLNRWNESDRNGRSGSSTRYVVVAGGSSNPWRFLHPELGSNDLVVETSSAYLPQDRDDVFIQPRGLVGIPFLAVLRDSRVKVALADLLGRYFRLERSHQIRTGGDRRAHESRAYGTLRARFDRPSYAGVLVAPEGSDPEESVLAVTLRSGRRPPEGYSLQAWVYLDKDPAPFDESLPADASRLTVHEIPLDGQASGLQGRLTLNGPGTRFGRAFLGVRLVPEGGGTPQVMEFTNPTVLDVDYSLVVEESPAAGATTVLHPAPQAGAEGRETVEPAGIDRTPGRADPLGRVEAVAEKNGKGGGPAGVLVFSETEGDSDEIPLIHVIRKSKMTTRKRENRTRHLRWEVDFGDGSTLTDPDSDHTDIIVEHAFDEPGQYEVVARSLAKEGRVLRQQKWDVIVSGDDLGGADGEAGPGVRTFRLQTVEEPEANLYLEGPASWIVGRPATFTIEAEIVPPPFAERVTVTYHPARVFQVQWAKPGRFRVLGAVTLRINYVLPERRLTLYNTYVTESEVEVLATTVTGG